MKWVSVKEQLPPDTGSVLAIQETGYKDNRVTIVATYARKHQLEASDSFDGWADYCEEKDTYFCPEGWYENQYNWEDFGAIAVNGEVTHWMELPKKPVNQK